MDELQRTQAEAVRIHQEYAQLKAEYDQLSSRGLMEVAQVAGAAVISGEPEKPRRYGPAIGNP